MWCGFWSPITWKLVSQRIPGMKWSWMDWDMREPRTSLLKSNELSKYWDDFCCYLCYNGIMRSGAMEGTSRWMICLNPNEKFWDDFCCYLCYTVIMRNKACDQEQLGKRMELYTNRMKRRIFETISLAICAIMVSWEVWERIIPHCGDRDLFWAVKNWQALCHSCHSKKTAAEDSNPEYRYWDAVNVDGISGYSSSPSRDLIIRTRDGE